jgi:HAE1 family hydrophobic/amphiphilic exporter-1
MAACDQLNQVLGQIKEVAHFTYISGTNFFSGAGSAHGMGFIELKDWSERNGVPIAATLGQLYQSAEQIKDANIIFFTPSSVSGYGESDGFEFKIIDKKAGNIEDLDQVASSFVGRLFGRKEILFAANSLNINYPQYEIELDVPKAKRLEVRINDILSTMQGYFGGFYIADFNKYGKPYKVFMQTPPNFRKEKEDLSKIFVKNSTGQMTPISSFLQLKRVTGAQSLSRFNLYNAVSVNGNAKPGFSSGDAIKAIQEEATSLPKNYALEFSGITREEINNAGQAPIIFGLSILFVFFFLAAQYESFLLPFAVLIPLPIGIAGAFLSTLWAGLENNIYFQIALIVLIGLLAKNAILIVEFAKQRRMAGRSIIESAIEGAKERLRPILMTSFAFILGLLPLVFAYGVGAEGNRSIGTGAAGGLLVGTVIGILVIPIIYVIFQWLEEKIRGQQDCTVL